MKIKTILFTLVAIFLFSCNQVRQENTKPAIAVSILPQEYFVSKIAGDLFEIKVLIPPGASPATYEPSPSQLTSLGKTRIYLEIGFTGFEMAWMDKIRSVNKNMKIYRVSEGIDLITEEVMHDNGHHENDHGHHHGGIDPHTWLSPKNVRIIAKNIYDVLSENYPEYKETFKKNLDNFDREIMLLDQQISSMLKDLDSRSFFTYHPSLSYYSRDYQLEQYPLELGGKTPSSSHMKHLVDTGKEKQIKLLLLQMQFDQKNAEVLAKEIGAKIIQINPLDPDWYNQMLFITEQIKENL